ncbi:MAG: polysaccharide deacetylase family protein, partial [Clostridia bacterium]
FTRSSIEKVNALGYKYVLWSWETDTRDWAHTPAKIIINTIKTKAKGGDILLFHDNVVGESHTAEALEVLIPYFLEQGFEFVTVSQLFEP